MSIGDRVKWNDGVHGPSTGEVLVPEGDGTNFTIVAMDSLAHAKPVVAVETVVLESENSTVPVEEKKSKKK